MQPMHLQLCAINCHLQPALVVFVAPLTIFAILLKLHLQINHFFILHFKIIFIYDRAHMSL